MEILKLAPSILTAPSSPRNYIEPKLAWKVVKNKQPYREDGPSAEGGNTANQNTDLGPQQLRRLPGQAPMEELKVSLQYGFWLPVETNTDFLPRGRSHPQGTSQSSGGLVREGFRGLTFPMVGGVWRF